MIHRLTALVFCLLATQASPATKPNIVFLLVDDLGWTDFGCFGSDLYQTPNIDKLCAEGMKFTNGYAACTVCSPTRAAVMSGKYPVRTGITNWISGPTMRLHHEETTLAEALRDGGYQTWHIGKWHLAPRGAPEVEEYYPEHQGFDVNIGGNHWGAPGSYFHPYSSSRKAIGKLPPGGKEGDYLTDRLTDEALELIDNRETKKPFFLSFWYYNVHTPIQGRPDLVEKYQGILEDGKKRRHKNAQYAGMVGSVDESVGRLMAKLKELGLEKDTLIFLTGDNGGLDRNGNPTENIPLRAGKGSAYEGGTRVPTIIHWPAVIKPGSVSDEPVISIDYYPTLLDITGIKGSPSHNAHVDGVSLLPILRNPEACLGRESLFWHYPHNHGGGSRKYGSIRKGDHILVEQYSTGTLELYDLKNDLSQTTDLATKFPEKTQSLHKEFRSWLKSVGGTIPVKGESPKKRKKR